MTNVHENFIQEKFIPKIKEKLKKIFRTSSRRYYEDKCIPMGIYSKPYCEYFKTVCEPHGIKNIEQCDKLKIAIDKITSGET